MKSTLYKLTFEVDSNNIEYKRDSNIDILLSDFEQIESEYPIYIPADGSIININDVDYNVMKNKSFIKSDVGLTIFEVRLFICNSKELENIKIKKVEFEIERELAQQRALMKIHSSMAAASMAYGNG